MSLCVHVVSMHVHVLCVNICEPVPTCCIPDMGGCTDNHSNFSKSSFKGSIVEENMYAAR